MVLSLQLIKEIGEAFTQRNFHCRPEQSQIKLYSEKDWKEFCKRNRFEEGGEAVYVPKVKTAYFRAGSPFFIPNYFHEYFGHGLLYEHSLLGKELEAVLHTDSDAQEFLQRKRERGMLGFVASNRENYEGFALWLEEQLCKASGNVDLWEQKYRGFSVQDRELVAFFQEAEQVLTAFGLSAQMGFPKYYTPNTLEILLRRWYASDSHPIDLALVYGSQKPYSDIDLLVVSPSPSRNIFNGWLDIYHLERSEFFALVEHFDISVTEALTTGTVICGKGMYEAAKKQMSTQRITKKAIRHNKRRAEELRAKADSILSEREQKADLSYAQSYQRTAQLLGQGKRVLGRADLV